MGIDGKKYIDKKRQKKIIRKWRILKSRNHDVEGTKRKLEISSIWPLLCYYNPKWIG